VRSDPKDKGAQRALADETEKIQGALDKVANVVDPSPDRDIAVAAREAREACDEMDDAARDGQVRSRSTALYPYYFHTHTGTRLW